MQELWTSHCHFSPTPESANGSCSTTSPSECVLSFMPSLAHTLSACKDRGSAVSISKANIPSQHRWAVTLHGSKQDFATHKWLHA
ncbi:hypothetical protein M758_9G010800 [Ceratodon purpureus]|nr:hypothetical protein M758_9G010800 [Ceratodon purpureus]